MQTRYSRAASIGRWKVKASIFAYDYDPLLCFLPTLSWEKYRYRGKDGQHGTLALRWFRGAAGVELIYWRLK